MFLPEPKHFHFELMPPVHSIDARSRHPHIAWLVVSVVVYPVDLHPPVRAVETLHQPECHIRRAVEAEPDSASPVVRISGIVRILASVLSVSNPGNQPFRGTARFVADTASSRASFEIVQGFPCNRSALTLRQYILAFAR